MIMGKETVYIYSMGKKLKITAIFTNDDEANAHIAKTDDAVVAMFGKYIIMANRYDQGSKP